MKNEDLAWLAGIIDGEGCFTIYSVKRKDTNNLSPSANITITNSDDLLLHRCKEILEELGVKHYYHDPKNGHQRGRKVMRLRIKNYGSICNLINAVLPYLVSKKEQAALMLEFASLAGKRGALVLSQRKAMMEKMQTLNHQIHLIA